MSEICLSGICGHLPYPHHRRPAAHCRPRLSLARDFDVDVDVALLPFRVGLHCTVETGMRVPLHGFFWEALAHFGMAGDGSMGGRREQGMPVVSDAQ